MILTFVLVPVVTWEKTPRGSYIATNSGPDKVTIEIDCGENYMVHVFSFWPRSREEVVINKPDGKPATNCFLTMQRVAKETTPRK